MPNETRTIVCGADLVAVDWVGASKMGIDPMLSKHMELAVGLFGKPEINLIGDANPYRPWLNVAWMRNMYSATCCIRWRRRWTKRTFGIRETSGISNCCGT